MPEPVPASALNMRRVDPASVELVQQEAPEVVVTDSAGHPDLGAGLCRRDGLVAALAAEFRAPGIARHGLALLRADPAHRP